MLAFISLITKKYTIEILLVPCYRLYSFVRQTYKHNTTHCVILDKHLFKWKWEYLFSDKTVYSQFMFDRITRNLRYKFKMKNALFWIRDNHCIFFKTDNVNEIFEACMLCNTVFWTHVQCSNSVKWQHVLREERKVEKNLKGRVNLKTKVLKRTIIYQKRRAIRQTHKTTHAPLSITKMAVAQIK